MKSKVFNYRYNLTLQLIPLVWHSQWNNKIFCFWFSVENLCKVILLLAFSYVWIHECLCNHLYICIPSTSSPTIDYIYLLLLFVFRIIFISILFSIQCNITIWNKVFLLLWLLFRLIPLHCIHCYKIICTLLKHLYIFIIVDNNVYLKQVYVTHTYSW